MPPEVPPPRSPSSRSVEPLELLRRSARLRVDAQGRWWHEGEPVAHERVAALFSRGLGWRPRAGGGLLDGEATLTVGAQWCYVECDRTPFLVTRLTLDHDHERAEEGGAGEARLWATLNTGAREEVGGAWLEGEVLFVELAGGAPARLSRGAQGQCAAWLEEGAGGALALRVGARLLPVGAAPPARG